MFLREALAQLRANDDDESTGARAVHAPDIGARIDAHASLCSDDLPDMGDALEFYLSLAE